VLAARVAGRESASAQSVSLSFFRQDCSHYSQIQETDRLRGKPALITGATSGIGLETAREFLQEGAPVAITGRSQADLDAARKSLGSDVVMIAADASDASSQKTVAEAVAQAFGKLDICSSMPESPF
jgi:NADPH:quinone reductase-like Zn-dependent oxidoreductase